MAQVETPFGPVTLQSPLLANVASVQLRLAKLRHEIAVARVKMLRARRRKSHWVKPWVNRRSEHGMYHRLMVELREENPADFCEFLRCPPALFDEMLERVTPRIEKQPTQFRAPLEPGLKLAMTLWHLATGESFRAMRFSWRVPHNTISLVVREVCEALCDIYVEEVFAFPTGEQGKVGLLRTLIFYFV